MCPSVPKYPFSFNPPDNEMMEGRRTCQCGLSCVCKIVYQKLLLLAIYNFINVPHPPIPHPPYTIPEQVEGMIVLEKILDRMLRDRKSGLKEKSKNNLVWCPSNRAGSCAKNTLVHNCFFVYLIDRKASFYLLSIQFLTPIFLKNTLYQSYWSRRLFSN